MDLDPHQQDNLANWNDRAGVHAQSAAYDLARYVADPAHLSDVITFDAPLIGSIDGLAVAHLQCHIGTDSVSLARLGARVVGLDFSERAIETARSLASATGADATFVNGAVYDAAAVIGRTVDLVYTSVGAINWLADLDRWAAAVAGLLEPGGRFFLRDMHPNLWTFEEIDGAIVPHHAFRTPPAGPLTWDTSETYTDGDHGAITNTRHHEWNHPISEIVNSLVGAGMTITRMEEFDELDWAFVPSAVLEDGRWYLPGELRHQVPQSFALWATRT